MESGIELRRILEYRHTERAQAASGVVAPATVVVITCSVRVDELIPQAAQVHAGGLGKAWKAYVRDEVRTPWEVYQ
jgi:hypothetical protein